MLYSCVLDVCYFLHTIHKKVSVAYYLLMCIFKISSTSNNVVVKFHRIHLIRKSTCAGLLSCSTRATTKKKIDRPANQIYSGIFNFALWMLKIYLKIKMQKKKRKRRTSNKRKKKAQHTRIHIRICLYLCVYTLPIKGQITLSISFQLSHV